MTNILRKLIVCMGMVPCAVLAATTCEKYGGDLQLLVGAEPAQFVTIPLNPYDKTSQDIGCATNGRFGRNVDLRFYQIKGGAAETARRWFQRYANGGLPSAPVSDTTLGSQGFFWLTSIASNPQPNMLIVAGHDANVYIRLEVSNSSSKYQLTGKDIEMARNLVKKAIADVAISQETPIK